MEPKIHILGLVGKLALVILLTFGIRSANAQSDTPCGAVPQTLGTSCTYAIHDASVDTYGTVAEAPNPSCGFYTSATLTEEDTWYSFVAPAAGSVVVSTSQVPGSTYNYASAAVYTGASCSSLTETTCFNGYGGTAFPSFNLTGLTPGLTYYVRVWGNYSNDANPRTHGFCAWAPPAPPANDECVNAFPVAGVNPDGYCNVVTLGTTAGGTASSQANWCGGTANNDVWFSFVATNTSHYFDLNNVTGPGLTYQVFSGTCGALANATCNSGVANNMTIGNTYFVRVWSTSGIVEASTFDICITTPPPQPPCVANPAAGNTACTATPLCNINGYCGTTSGTYSADSWPELFNEAASCFPDIDNNSFLQITAEATEISFWVWVENCNSPSGIQIMVFSAINCGSGPVDVYECYSPGNVPVSAVLVSAAGLTIGDQYYIMVDGNAGAVCDYTIAAHEGIALPVEVESTTGDTTVCAGGSIDLYATGGSGNYTWSPGTWLDTTVGDTVTSTPLTSGSVTYTVNSSASNPICPMSSSQFTLTVTDAVTGTDTQQACSPYTWIDGVTYAASNNTATFTIVGGSIAGCDSIVTLDLTISNSVSGTDTQEACEPYTWIDGVTYATTNNTATYTIVGGSVAGCDSIVTLDLTIAPAVTGTDTQVACGSFTWVDGVTYTANNNTATFTYVGGSVAGCDSIVTLDLTIAPVVTGTDVQVACGSYTWIDGVTYAASNNTATFTIVGGSVAGCDSVVTLDLTIAPAVTGTDVQVACGSYTWIDGVTYSASTNTPTFTIVGGSVAGCDSIVTLDLTIAPAVTGTDTQLACGSYTWIDGVTYTASTNTPTLTIIGGSVAGCDSIVTLDLTIGETVTGTDIQSACEAYTWIDGVNYTSNNNTATFTIVGGSVAGCDSTVTLDLTISNAVTGTDTQVACGAYTWIDGITYLANTNTATFNVVGGSVNGCDSIVTLDLTIHPEVLLDLGQDIGICDDPIELTPGSGFSTFLWNTGSTSSSITISEEGTYSVYVTDENGCTASDQIEVIDDCPFSVWVPNAFTTNDDGINETFHPVLSTGDVSKHTLSIYNRWGQLIHASEDGQGWDGKYQGGFVQDGVYVWKLKFDIKPKDGKKEYVGHVTLLK